MMALSQTFSMEHRALGPARAVLICKPSSPAGGEVSTAEVGCCVDICELSAYFVSRAHISTAEHCKILTLYVRGAMSASQQLSRPSSHSARAIGIAPNELVMTVPAINLSLLFIGDAPVTFFAAGSYGYLTHHVWWGWFLTATRHLHCAFRPCDRVHCSRNNRIRAPDAISGYSDVRLNLSVLRIMYLIQPALEIFADYHSFRILAVHQRDRAVVNRKYSNTPYTAWSICRYIVGGTPSSSLDRRP
jgi:hypothetical protein